MITRGDEKNLSFMFQSSERLRMDDPVSVVLEGRAERALLLKDLTAFRIRTQRRERGENLFLPVL